MQVENSESSSAPDVNKSALIEEENKIEDLPSIESEADSVTSGYEVADSVHVDIPEEIDASPSTVPVSDTAVPQQDIVSAELESSDYMDFTLTDENSEKGASETSPDNSIGIPLERTYFLFGYEIKVSADKGKTAVTYPSFIISDEDILRAARDAYVQYGSIYDLGEIQYSINDGVLTLTYPESWGEEEYLIAESTLMDVLPSYVEYLTASSADDIFVEDKMSVSDITHDADGFAQDTAIEDAESDESEDALSIGIYDEADDDINDSENDNSSLVPFEKTYYLFGYEINVSAEKGKAAVTYPSFIISDEDIMRAAREAYTHFGSIYDLDSIRYTVNDGVLTLTYPENWEEEEYLIAESTLMDVLPSYVEYIITSSENDVEVDEKIAVDDVTSAGDFIALSVPLEASPDISDTSLNEENESAIVCIPVERTYLLSGYEINVSAEKGKATVTYPSHIISDEDIMRACRDAYTYFGSIYDLDGIRYSINDDVLTLTYPEILGEKEYLIAESTLMDVLPSYVEYLIASNDDAEVEDKITVLDITHSDDDSAIAFIPDEESVESLSDAVTVEESSYERQKEAAAVVSEAEDSSLNSIDNSSLPSSVEEKVNRVRNSSIAVSVNPSFNLQKGFNLNVGLGYEYGFTNRISAGVKAQYNLTYGYAQAHIYGRYAFMIFEGSSDIYGKVQFGGDYTFMAGKAALVVGAGGGFEYSFTDAFSAFAEVIGQYSFIRHFDITAEIGLRYSF